MSGGSSINRLSTGCVLVRGGSLSCPNVGRAGSSYANRLVTSCVPVPGSCLPGPGYVGVGISNANRSVTGCPGYVGVGIGYWLYPGTNRPGPGVGWIGNSYLVRFGLAPLRDPSRRVCPGSGVTASAPTAPVTIGISFGTRSGHGSDPRGRQKFTSVSAVPSSTGPSPVPTTLSSPSDCSRLFFWPLLFEILV